MRFEARAELPHDVDTVYRWHARPGALERLTPPWERIRVVRREGGIEGGFVELDVRIGPAWRRWRSRHVRAQPPTLFVDEQERGPFAAFRHEHRFAPTASGGTAMADVVDHEPPMGALGRAVAGRSIHARLERMFAQRHRQLARDLARHAEHPGPRLAVGITGASGLIGSHLAPFLSTGGHEVRALPREPSAAALEGLDAIVHLAGEPIGRRWTKERRARIMASRKEGTARLVRAIAAMREPPSVLLTASAVGYYGDRGDEVLDESSAQGTGFLAEVCAAWEEAARPAAERGVRVAHARTGIVMSARGGALAQLLPPFRAGAGGRVGDGRAWWSWIDIDDEIGAMHHILRTPALSGPVLLVGPAPVRSVELTQALARTLGRPHLAPVPRVALRAAFGEMADQALVASQRAMPKKLLASGFRFAHASISSSLAEQLGKPEVVA